MLKHRLQNADTHSSFTLSRLYRSPGLNSWAGIAGVPPSQLIKSSAAIPSHCDKGTCRKPFHQPMTLSLSYRWSQKSFFQGGGAIKALRFSPFYIYVLRACTCKDSLCIILINTLCMFSLKKSFFLVQRVFFKLKSVDGCCF